MSCPTCQSPEFRSFTFSTSETLSLCPACGYESGHSVLRVGSVNKLQNVAADLQDLWFSMLARQDLGEDRAISHRWLVYGCEYHDADIPLQYTDAEKIARRPRHHRSSPAYKAAVANARKRFEKYRASTLRICRSFGWQVNHGKARFVGVKSTRSVSGTLVEEAAR